MRLTRNIVSLPHNGKFLAVSVELLFLVATVAAIAMLVTAVVVIIVLLVFGVIVVVNTCNASPSP